MYEEEDLKPPKPSTVDTAHLVASGILSLIPGAPELFRKFVTPPLEKRQYAWMERVAFAIKELQQEKNISLDELQSDESFLSLVLHATSVAIRNHHEEKLESLANIVLNSAVPIEADRDLELAFIRFIDELTPLHVKLLFSMAERENDIAFLKSYEQLYAACVDVLPQSISREHFKMLCLDLQTRALIRISPDFGEFEDIYEASALLLEQQREDLPLVRVTEIGRSFLLLISKSMSAA